MNYKGDIVLDTFVAPTMLVTDYRFSSTGLTLEHFSAGTFNNQVGGKHLPTYNHSGTIQRRPNPGSRHT